MTHVAQPNPVNMQLTKEDVGIITAFLVAAGGGLRWLAGFFMKQYKENQALKAQLQKESTRNIIKAIDDLKGEMVTGNKEIHRRLDEHTVVLNEHGKRISKLESKE